MARNSRYFESPFDVLQALEDVITDALDQGHIGDQDLADYLDAHFHTPDVIDAWREENE